MNICDMHSAAPPAGRSAPTLRTTNNAGAFGPAGAASAERLVTCGHGLRTHTWPTAPTLTSGSNNSSNGGAPGVAAATAAYGAPARASGAGNGAAPCASVGAGNSAAVTGAAAASQCSSGQYSITSVCVGGSANPSPRTSGAGGSNAPNSPFAGELRQHTHTHTDTHTHEDIHVHAAFELILYGKEWSHNGSLCVCVCVPRCTARCHGCGRPPIQ